MKQGLTYRIIVTGLVLLLLLSVPLPERPHECTGETCLVCILTDHSASPLKYVGFVSFAVLFVLSRSNIVAFYYSQKNANQLLTLFQLKVRFNN